MNETSGALGRTSNDMRNLWKKKLDFASKFKNFCHRWVADNLLCLPTDDNDETILLLIII